MNSKPKSLDSFCLVSWGDSSVALIKILKENHIPSPRGKAKWSKCTLETILSNEKSFGKVHLFTNNEYKDKYLFEDNHTATISKYVFEKVQSEKSRWSNAVRIGEEEQ